MVPLTLGACRNVAPQLIDPTGNGTGMPIYLLHDQATAIRYMRMAVAKAPYEAAYRIQLTHMLAISGQTDEAARQIEALRRMDSLGRFDAQIRILQQQIEAGRAPAH